jgi:hypothetical protein
MYFMINTQRLSVRLSDPPEGTVTVRIENVAGAEKFGFDVCELIFTSSNWYVF